jgi:hypothetical protein
MFKKLFMVLALMALTAPAFASVGIRVNGTMAGTATDINIVCGSGANTTGANLSPDGSLYNIGCSPNLAESGFANAGYVSLASTGATISPTYTYVFKVLDTDQNALYTAGTLPNGTPGQMLTITAIGYNPNPAGTNATYTLSFATSPTLLNIKFTKIGDTVTLIYLDDTNGWLLQSSGNSTNSSGLTVNYR